MSRVPFTPAELGVDDASLASAAAELERYAQLTQRGATPSFVASVLAAVEAEPAPRRGPWAALLAPGGALRQSFAMLAAVGVIVAAIGIGFLLGRVADGPAPGVGTSPSPSQVVATPSASPAVTPNPTPSPTLSPTPSASPTPAPSADASTARENPTTIPQPTATASDDSGGNSGPSGGSSPEATDGSSSSGSGSGRGSGGGSGSGSDDHVE